MTSTINPKSSLRSRIQELLNSLRKHWLSPPYLNLFRTTRFDPNGSSMVRQKEKCSTPQATRLASPNLAAQTCMKLDPDMGEGLFAKRNIKLGDLIFAERPLLVSPRAISSFSRDPTPKHYTAQQYQQVGMFEYESLLEKTIDRLSPQSQADFRALHNAHTGDGSGPLLGIIRTNGYGIDQLYDGSNQAAIYGAVCKIGSRINHRCVLLMLLSSSQLVRHG